jgi:hypothetical protein
VQVVLIAAVISIFIQRPTAANALPSAAPAADPAQAPDSQIIIAGNYLWSYAAKFVCGYQRPTAVGVNTPGEPIVKPSNYATEINIHNPNYKQAPLRKKFIVIVKDQAAVREPEQTQPSKVLTMTLGADMVTMDDCNNLWQIINTTAPPAPMPVFIGYLVILSPVELDVDVVYTANAPGDLHVDPTGISIDVERVTGKRIFLPHGILP